MSMEHDALTPAGEARLRAEVARAADILFPSWPISSFIAVNPLGNLSHLPFDEAAEQAGRALGAVCYWQPQQFLEARDKGRIDDVDLAAASERARAEGEAGEAPLGLEDLLEQKPDRDLELQAMSPCERLDRRYGGARAAVVEAEVSKWCAAFLDEGEASWPMPGRELGFYRCWRDLAAADGSSRRLGAGDLREAARALDDSPAAALAGSLATLGLDQGARMPILRRLLARHQGWASAIRWQSERQHRPEHPIDLVQLLAVITFYESALARCSDVEWADGGAGSPDPDGPSAGRRRQEIWLEAYEWHYRDRLLAALDRDQAVEAGAERPAAQAVFCIDARSEGLRRHLEQTGSYETLGFAGFFGLAIRHRPFAGAPASATAQCPVLLSPAAESIEQPLPGSERDAERWSSHKRSDAAAIETFHRVKNDLSSKFALAELAGWAFGPAAVARTLAPGARRRLADVERPSTMPVIDRPTPEEAEAMAIEIERGIVRELVRAHLGARRQLAEHELERLREHAAGAGPAPERPEGCAKRRWRELLASLPAAALDPRAHEDRVEQLGALGLSRAEQSQWAQVALTMMGLVDGFGRLILLCGHGSSNLNNPFRSSLDCGACGGNAGRPNARMAASLLNSKAVREDLAEAGIEIPADSWFVAGLHDTATDRVEIFDREQIPLTHRSDLLALERDLGLAGAALSAERLERLGDDSRGAEPRRASRRRSLDWAQIRPEWGLARNAAFIVGPREVSAGLDLECRSFLHSYRAEVDRDGSALETILTAPLVVAEWINLQYYFSTVDLERFGSGDKTIHNVVGRRGVQLGPGGDLRIGLPRQAVFSGARHYHEPMRLLAIVQAPLERISEIIERNAVLQEMLGGGWAAMCARERAGERWQRLRRDLTWEPWSPADPRLLDRQTATKGDEGWLATA